METIGQTKPTIIKQKPAKVYIPEADYNRLQSKLRAKGSDVSKWFREKVYEELNKPVAN